ncbi:MAG: hypothetical protein LUH02_10350, partial [Erysipelotrichaceae bacterium]|nr:hypothetical protein [Erysipelotrichaceae bacterium]
MEFIKKFAREISVFGIVIVIFLGLFIYRQATFKDYTTVSESKLTSLVEKDKDFIVVIGDSTESSMSTYEPVLTTFCTKNRSYSLYYLDSSEIDNIATYVEETFDLSVTYPVTIIVKDGEVVNYKQGSMTYYYLYEFVTENY